MALADLHNVDAEGEATIAHTDITPGQFIKVGDTFKLNDFNRARFLPWSQQQQRPCSYLVGNNGGKFRSPEEYRYDPQTEMVCHTIRNNQTTHVLPGRRIFSRQYLLSTISRRMAVSRCFDRNGPEHGDERSTSSHLPGLVE